MSTSTATTLSTSVAEIEATPRYLTSLTLDGRHPRVRHGVVDCHHMHTLVMSGFLNIVPNGRQARSELAVLYATRANRDSTISVIVQSALPPSWNDLHAGTGIIGEPHTWVPHQPQVGDTYAFQLTASPNQATGPKGQGQRRKRRFISDPAAQTEWLTRRSESSGFAFDPAAVTATSNQMMHSDHKSLPPARRSHPNSVFKLGTTTYIGTLAVTDATTFADALREGIGPGKAYGCGLLLTRRSTT